MAKNTQIATPIANLQADELARQLDDGYLRIYSGTQPANADTALGGGNTLLVTLRFANPCAPAAINGVLTFTPPASVYAPTSGTATFFRALKADGTTVVLDGTVGIAADTPNLIVLSTAMTAGQLIVVGSLSHTVLRASSGL